MALLCNDCTVEGKKRSIRCKHTGEPCVFVRFCGVSGHYYQTDQAARCRMKGQANEKEQNGPQTG